jgi:hypothetical protein
VSTDGVSVAADVSVATGGSVATVASVAGGSVTAVVGSRVGTVGLGVEAGAQAARIRAKPQIAPSKVFDFILTYSFQRIRFCYYTGDMYSTQWGLCLVNGGLPTHPLT